MPAASSSRSARACWSTARGGALNAAWLDSLAARRRRLGRSGQAGDPGLVRRHRARPARARACRGASWSSNSRRRPPPSGRSRSPAPTRTCSRRTGSPPRRSCSRSATPRSAAAISTRAQTIATLLAQRRRPGGQRERHGGHRRDPLRRQRPPLRPRRQHDERRLPGAALRHRRPLHRRSAGSDPTRRRSRRGARRSRRRSRPWPASAGTELSRGGMVTKIEAAPHRAGRRLRHGDRRRARCCIRCGALTEGARLHLVPGAVRSRDGAQALDRGPARAQGRAGHRRRRRAGAARRQEPAAGRRRRGSRARSSAAMPSSSAAPERPRARARPRRLCARPMRERIIGRKSGEIAAILGYRGPRRADPSRRHGAEQDQQGMNATPKAEARDAGRCRPRRCGRSAAGARAAAAESGARVHRGQERRAPGRRARAASRGLHAILEANASDMAAAEEPLAVTAAFSTA